MKADPYRAPASRHRDPTRPASFAGYDVAAAAVLTFLLALIRVAFAVGRSEPPSRELDIAWLVVMLAPLVVWKEIAARRGRG